MNKDDIQNHVLKLLEPVDRATVALSMGTGKTLLGLKHMAQRQLAHMKFLVVAPKLSVFESWKEESKIHNLEYLQESILYCTYRSLSKIELDQYDILYLDEVHNLTINHNQCLSKYKGKILGLTGTPPKSIKSHKGFMIDKYCPVIYNYNTDTAINDKLLNNYKIYVHLLKLSEHKTIKTKWNALTSEKATYDYWTKRVSEAFTPKGLQMARIMRMKVLKEFKSKEDFGLRLFNSIQNKCLLFANTQAQAERLCKYNYHSKNKGSENNLNLFKLGSITKLSCVEQLNEGINIPNLKEGIVLHAYGNERKFSQKLGRFLRLNPNDEAIIHILCYKNTIDEIWVKNSLEDLDQTKITWK